MSIKLVAYLVIIFAFAITAYVVVNKWLKVAFALLALTGFLSVWYLSSIKIGMRFPVQDKNGQFEFALVPTKGRDMEVMQRHLDTYKKQNEIKGDVQLYRLKKKNYLDLSMWLNYSQNPYWDLEYIEEN